MPIWIRRGLQVGLVSLLVPVALLSIGVVRAWPVIGPGGWNPADVFTSDEMARFYELPRLAMEAVEEERMAEARDRADELLLLAPRFPNNWNYGNAIHDGHAVLGLVALAEDDVEAAKMHLLAAGATPGSPQLDTFGPTMLLAKALLEKGETATVLEYLERCRPFWELEQGRLDRWSEVAAAGEMPAFGGSLRY
jgi:hypothetical protein